MPVGYAKRQRRETVYVVFQTGKRGRIWSAFLRPGWGHCWIMVPAWKPEPGILSDCYAVKIEAQSWGIDVDVWWEHPAEIARQWAEEAVAVVEIEVDIPPGEGIFVPRGLFTCVGLVKAVLGLNNWRLLTPWDLFLHLLHNGGQLIRSDSA